MLQSELRSSGNKVNLKLADLGQQAGENTKKLEWLETLIGGMKKRLSEVSRQGKDNAAQQSLLASGTGFDKDARDDDARQKELIETVDENLRQMEYNFNIFKAGIENEFRSMG